jgi:hypothetical protein
MPSWNSKINITSEIRKFTAKDPRADIPSSSHQEKYLPKKDTSNKGRQKEDLKILQDRKKILQDRKKILLEMFQM